VRICHVAPELLPVPPVKGGAIERWIRDAAGQLAKRGHDVHVVSRDHDDGTQQRRIDGVSYHFVRIPPFLDRGRAAALGRGLWYFRGVGRVLRQLRPDVVHHHSRPAGAYLSSGFAASSRQVISLHSMSYGWNFCYRAWDRVLFRRAFAASARVLCVSEFIRRHTLDLYPELDGKMATLYNGVDDMLFHPDAAATFDSPEPTILFVGRVEERKGVHLLLDAFERSIGKQIRGAQLKIVGPHSYWNAEPSAYYLSLAERCRTIPRVQLLGPTYVDADLAAVYRSATIAVVPSVFPEALGLTSLEAQASGVPVVVSSAGGLPETVRPGESGVVFDNGDVDGLASAVLGLLSDRRRLQTMAVAARAWAIQQFSWRHIASQLETIYAQIAA
jgi:glycosyltransferase involved in cell wall biosynthesis